MNSDNYEYAKSMHPQSVEAYSAFTDKQYNYINDTNSGVYSNNSGLSQVQFDLTSIYNSGGFTSTADMYLTIPIILTAQCVTAAGASIAIPAASLGGLGAVASAGGFAGQSLVTLKSNYQNLIHQMDIQADGKVINETQPFTNVIQGFRMLSQMSTTDLNTWGPSLNWNQAIDNEKSMTFNRVPLTVGAIVPSVASVVAAASVPSIPAFAISSSVTYTTPSIASLGAGGGMLNNIPYFSGVAGCPSQNAGQSAMNAGCVNQAIANRISRFADLGTSADKSAQSFWGTSSATVPTIMNATQLANEYKPTFSTVGGILVWNDVAIIPLKYIADVFDKMGLVRKLSAVVRLYLNTGSCSVACFNPGLQTQYFGPTANSTFSNTCPFTINNVGGVGTIFPSGTAFNLANVPATTAFICAGCFVAKAPTTAIGVGGASVNIGLGVSNHPMPSCRAYYSLVKMEPSKALSYVEQNRNKLVVYEQFITNQYNAIPSGGSYSQLVQSGIKNPIAIAIIPFISGTNLNPASVAYGFNQYGSCLDTCPVTFAPLSLTNLQITLGGTNILNSTLFYTYNNYLEQIGLADNLTSSDLGMGAGLISQSWWENNRVYYVDLKRSRDADKATTRNLNISFTNNSNVIIDIMVFTLYLDKLVVDCETGLITKPGK